MAKQPRHNSNESTDISVTIVLEGMFRASKHFRILPIYELIGTDGLWSLPYNVRAAITTLAVCRLHLPNTFTAQLW